MERTEDLYQECSRLLSEQTAALIEISRLQEEVKEAVRTKRWEDYERIMLLLREYGAQMEALESRRRDIMQDVNIQGGEFRFYAFITRFDDERRRSLGGLYRQMKLTAAKIRFTNNALCDYLNAELTLVSGVLEAAFPDRRGILYGRLGRPKNADMRSVILNKTF